ncbi:MAG: HDIG domain-containing protein [Acidobacteriota bacterium]|nr:HDIG domain-containing protein [Acidobacteriota bacterium]
MNREDAWQLVQQNVQAEGLRRHMLSVEAAMAFYADKLQQDAEPWRLAGILHDFDWEIHPSLEAHPAEGAPILRAAGCPEPVVQAILSHNEVGTGVERSEPMDYALLACDEVTGLVIASTLVRPSKDVRDVKLKSLRKRWKEKAFARGVDREEVETATADFSRVCFEGGLELWDHVQNVLGAMQGAAETLGLDGRLAQNTP